MLWNADLMLYLVRLEATERLRAAEQQRFARTVVAVQTRPKP